MILIFDLDDTLYQEELYALSGFKAVAHYTFKAYGIPVDKVFNTLLSALISGHRDKAFQELIIEWNLPRSAIEKCLAEYRSHLPNIHLEDETKKVLNKYSKVNKYVVTDGNKLVQKRKVEALKLDRIFNRCFITHNFGLKAAKPSTICFEKIKTIESVNWEDLVYIGDDPQKDFVNLKPLGVKTIRVMTGRHSRIEVPSNFDAEIRIPNLTSLLDVLH